MAISGSKPRGRPASGRAISDAERMRRLRVRRKAQGLKEVSRWIEAGPVTIPPYSSHRLLEVRSLVMHLLIADKMLRDPALVEHARRNIRRWKARDAGDLPEGLRQWERILERPTTEIASIMTEPSERAAQLRQSSPFAGLLSAGERRRIHEALRS